jgi:hypothetical protein
MIDVPLLATLLVFVIVLLLAKLISESVSIADTSAKQTLLLVFLLGLVAYLFVGNFLPSITAGP